MEKSRIWFCIFIFLCQIKAQNALPARVAEGKYPKAIGISNNRVALLFNTGGILLDSAFNDVTLTTRFHSNLRTDIYSNLFRLNNDSIILVKEEKHVIVSIWNENFNLVQTSPPYSTPKRSSFPYQFAIITSSLTNEFIITFDDQVVKYQVTNQAITKLQSYIITNASGLSCDFSPINMQFVCAYFKSTTLYYAIYNSNFLVIQSSEKTYNTGLIEKPIIKRIQLNSFVICYIGRTSEFCINVSIKQINSTDDIITSDNGFTQPIVLSENNEINYMVFSPNFFICGKFNNKMLFINLSSKMKQINTFEEVPFINNNEIGNPFIFNIGKIIIGYVFQSNTEIFKLSFTLPTCNARKVQTRTLTIDTIMFDTITNMKYVFHQIPNNAILSQNNTAIDSDNSYLNPEFTYQTLSSTGIAIWMFSVYDENSQFNSLLCEFELDICYSSCQTCTDYGSDSDHKCDLCIQGYNKKENTNDCYDNNTIEPNYFLDTDNLYKPCFANCKTCTKAGTLIENNCDSCITNYYPIEDKIHQCIDTLPQSYYFDSISKIYKKCYSTCQTCSQGGYPGNHHCTQCIPDYTNINDQCIVECPHGWYINNGVKLCLTLNEACPNQYPYTIDGTKECVNSCSPFGNLDCMPCQVGPLFLHEGKCIKRCPINYVEDYQSHKCKNSSGPDPPDPGPDPPGPVDPPVGSRLKIYEYNSTDCFGTIPVLIANYINRIDYLVQANSNTAVDLIYHCKSENCSITYYNILETDIKPKVYNKFNVSEINFTPILTDIRNPSSTLVMQIDKYRESEFTNQTEYYLFSSNGTTVTLDSDSKHHIIVTSPIRSNYYPNITMMQLMADKNIDILNRSALFYNDICFKYTDENDRDITIEDRRLKYYPKTELCEMNCNYVSFEDYKITCNCLFNATLEFTNKTVENPPANPFIDKDFQTYTVVTCASEVFKLNDILANISFWIFLAFLITIIVLAFCFICTGMTYANNYIIDVLKASKQLNTNQSSNIDFAVPNPNPPPKSKDNKREAQTPEESFHTKIEEEEFDDVKINNYQKKEKARLRQNFIKQLDYLTPGENTKGEKDEKALILKLKDELMEKNSSVAQDLQKYFFTKNSENESNPNYSSQVDKPENETGKSFSNRPINSSFIKEMLIYGEGESDLIDEYDDDKKKKRQLGHQNSDLSSEKIQIRKQEHSVSQENQEPRNNIIKTNSIIPYKPIQIGNKTEQSLNKHLSLLDNKSGEDKHDEMAKDPHNNNNQSSERDKINSNDPLVKNRSVVNKDDDNDVNVKTPKSFCRAYFNYLKKREIFMITFFSNKSYLPFFITFPIFLFCLAIMFTIHALAFTNGFIHERFAKEGSIDFVFWMENEFFKSLYVALIGNVVKIIIIKILIFFVFRIEKKMLSRQNYPIILQRLRRRSATIFVILIILMGALFYINTCYCGIFVNTQADLFIGYAVSVLISFLIALLLCFIINIIRLLGISCNCA